MTSDDNITLCSNCRAVINLELDDYIDGESFRLPDGSYDSVGFVCQLCVERGEIEQSDKFASYFIR